MTLDGLNLFALDTHGPPDRTEPPADVPVVLVHGLGMSIRSFRRLIPVLRESGRVIALDLPGCGRSDRPNGMTIDDVVSLVWRWLTELDVPRARLVGHSLGSQVVTRMAVQRPDRVDGLILVAPCPDPTAKSRWQTAARLLLDGLREPLGLIRVAVTDYLRARPRRMWSVYARSLKVVDVTTLRKVGTPAVIVVGEHDRVAGRGAIRILRDNLRNARVVTVPDGTHGLPYQSPRAVAEALRQLPT